MTTSLAALNFLQYRERYPYGGAAVRSMHESEASREAEGVGVLSVDTKALMADLVEETMLEFERTLVKDLGLMAGRELSDVDVIHVFIDSPNALTLFDPNDGSYAIGVDPGFFHAISTLYLNAALGQRVNDPKRFLILATKTVGWFWVGSFGDWTEDYNDLITFVRKEAPDIFSFSRDLVNTAISFTIAHEVGHIMLGHLEGEHARTLPLTEGGPASRASAMDSKDLELAADAWAAEALFRWAGNDFKRRTLVLGVPALCFCLSALKSTMTVPATNEIARATADSHPPEMDRAQQVHSLARSHAADVAGSDALKHFVDLGFWVNEQRMLLERQDPDWVERWFRSSGPG